MKTIVHLFKTLVHHAAY